MKGKMENKQTATKKHRLCLTSVGGVIQLRQRFVQVKPSVKYAETEISRIFAANVTKSRTRFHRKSPLNLANFQLLQGQNCKNFYL